MHVCYIWDYDKNNYYILYIFYATLLQEVHLQKCMEIYGLAARFSERFKLQSTSVHWTRMGWTLWIAQTDLKVTSIFLIFPSYKKKIRSNTDTLNSWTQYMVQSIIKSPILPCQTGTSQFNWQLYVKLRLNVLTARFGKCLITDR